MELGREVRVIDVVNQPGLRAEKLFAWTTQGFCCRTRDPKVQHLSVNSNKLMARKFLRVRLWSIQRETVCRDQAAAFRLPQAAPVRRIGVAEIGNGIGAALTDAWCSRGLGTIHTLIYWLHQEIQP